MTLAACAASEDDEGDAAEATTCPSAGRRLIYYLLKKRGRSIKIFRLFSRILLKYYAFFILYSPLNL